MAGTVLMYFKRLMMKHTLCEYITAESQEIHEACIAQLTSNEELMEQINNLTDSFKILYFNRLYSIAC